jgi:hypothetical protein
MDLFKRKKPQEDPLDVLRQAYSGAEAEKQESQSVNNDPSQITIEKHQAITITQTEQPQIEGRIPPETFDDKMQRFKTFLDVVKGKVEIGSRLKPLLDPDNLQTTTRLTGEEVDFVSDANWLANQWRVFEPLRDLAREISETKISEGGKGREEAISFMGALTEGKLLKGLMLGAEVPPKRSRFSFRGKGERKEEGEQ